MFIQEKQFFHQQRLRTCVNNIFLYTDLYSVCAQQHVFLSLGVEDPRSEVHGGSLKGVGIFLQISRFFLMETYIAEESIQSENLSMFEFNPSPFILITYKFGLVFYHLIGWIKFICVLVSYLSSLKLFLFF